MKKDMKTYSFERMENLAAKPKPLRMETNLVIKEIKKHLDRGYRFINL